MAFIAGDIAPLKDSFLQKKLASMMPSDTASFSQRGILFLTQIQFVVFLWGGGVMVLEL